MRKEEARAALQAEADAKGFGTLYAACDGGKNGLEACQAIEALCEVRRQSFVLSTTPLTHPRVHGGSLSLAVSVESDKCEAGSGEGV